MTQIVRACSGLIHVDEGSQVLHYVHSSLHQYLFKELDGKEEGFKYQETNLYFSSICLTYFNYQNFTKQIIIAPKKTPSLEPLDMARAQFSSNTLGSRLVRKLLQSRSSGASLDLHSIRNFVQEETPSRTMHYKFFEYVSQSWLKQITDVTFLEELPFWNRLHRCIQNRNLDDWKPWMAISESNTPHVARADAASIWAILNGHNILVFYQMVYENCDISDETWNKLAGYIVKQGGIFVGAVVQHYNTMERILRTGTELVVEIGVDGLRALIAAGIDVNSADTSGQTVLHRASIEGNTGAVRTLLEVGADINAATVIHRKTSLSLASENGYLEIVKTLLEAGADPNATDIHGRTSLHRALDAGCTKIINKLIEAGADPEAIDFRGETPLHRACSMGEIVLVEALLDAGAIPNAIGTYQWTPLHQATIYGHVDIVKALLARGADVSAANRFDATPLHLASEKGHYEIVKALLEAGTSVNLTKASRENARVLAKEAGHKKIVRYLEGYQKGLQEWETWTLQMSAPGKSTKLDGNDV